MLVIQVSSMLKKILILLSLAIINPSFAIEVGDSLTIREIKTLDQSILPPSYWQDKFILVQVWASWCPYCQKQNINLQSLAEQTKNSNLRILAISIDQNPKNAIEYQKKYNYQFPMAMMTESLAKEIGKRRGIPETYLINPQGKVIQKNFGLMVDAEFFEYQKFSQ